MTTSVGKVLASVRPLLAGGGAFIIGNSLLGIVLPLRMTAAGYPVMLIGLVMAAYYAGLALGGIQGKRVILRVGHIRAFAVFAAVLATTALAYPVAFTVPTWIALRLVNGFCIAGLLATVESWLNDRSSNATRGRVLGLYMMTIYLAVASGQVLVSIADIESYGPFMLAAALITLSLVPVALTSLGAPALAGHRRLGVRTLYANSPVGVVGAAVAGMLVGSFYGLGVVFARGIGLDVAHSALFMTMVVVGGFVFQWPIGMLADRLDRRIVLAAVLTAVALAWALVAFASASAVALPALYGLAVVFGGAISSVYPLCVAQTFDRLERQHYVSASGRLLMIHAFGAMAGPLLASALMAAYGPYGFFLFESTVAVGFAVFAAYRVWRRPPAPPDQQERFVAVPDVTPVAADLDPRCEGRAMRPA